jgi:hypothetical protein
MKIKIKSKMKKHTVTMELGGRQTIYIVNATSAMGAKKQLRNKLTKDFKNQSLLKYVYIT